jgi:hypothetical protein
MSRKRAPTDELLTDIYESKDRIPRAKQSTAKGHDTHETHDTRVDRPPGVPPPLPPMLPPPEPPQQPTPPIRVISLKTPAEIEAEEKQKLRARDHKVSIRPLSEIRKQHDTPAGGFGHLAPPRDPKEVRARRLRDHVIWGSLVVILACAVMLGVWFLAR